MKEKIVIVSGGFDPLHIGHIRYFQEAKKLGDYLVVILNSDKFLVCKKDFCFMNFDERREIIEELQSVSHVVECIDSDNSVCETLKKFADNFREYDLIFAKGGDRTIENILESKICEDLGIKMVFNVGGEKVQSSSELVNKIRGNK